MFSLYLLRVNRTIEKGGGGGGGVTVLVSSQHYDNASHSKMIIFREDWGEFQSNTFLTGKIYHDCS